MSRLELTRDFFEITVLDEPEALSRLLAPFAVAQATLAHVEYVGGRNYATARIATLGLTPDRAELLRARLAQGPRVIAARRSSTP